MLKVEGLPEFEVTIADNRIPGIFAVIDRIYHYFQSIDGMLHLFSTKYDNERGAVVSIEGRSHERFDTANDNTLATDSSLREQLHRQSRCDFIIDANLFEKPIVVQGETAGDGTTKKVGMSLSCFCHTAVGASAVGRIRGHIVGEITRTNRRWRRKLANCITVGDKTKKV